MSNSPTSKTVIGQFDNPSNLDIFQTVGMGGNVICGMNYAGLVYPISVPVVQNSLLAINTSSNQSVSNTAIATSLFNVAIFMQSADLGGAGTTTVATISYTDVNGVAQSVTLVLHGDQNQIQQENYVLLAKIGTTITVSTAFSGAAFQYTIAVAIAILPTAGGLIP
jgi:hypothetical protein